MGNPREELSIVVDAGLGEGHSCGYCGGKNGSVSHGMPVRKLTVYAYQDLIDQGWRRSGTYLYKPDMTRTCCKAYTIRLDVNQFTPDKQQRRLLRKWSEFLSGTVPSANPNATSPMETGGAVAAETGIKREEQQDANVSQDPKPPEQLNQQEKPGGTDEQGTTGLPEGPLEVERQEVKEWLAAALSSAITAGELPGVVAGRVALIVRRCTEKQRRAVQQPNVHFTSSSAFALAATVAEAAEAEAVMESSERLKIPASSAAAAAAAIEQFAPTAVPMCEPEVLPTCTPAASDSPDVPSSAISCCDTSSAHSSATQDRAAASTGQPRHQQRQQQRKRDVTLSSVSRSIRPSAQMVADVLSRHFNMLCAGGLAPATTTAVMVCGTGGPPADATHDASDVGVGEGGRSCREVDSGGVNVGVGGTDANLNAMLEAGGGAPIGPHGAESAIAARVSTAMDVDAGGSLTLASRRGPKYQVFSANGHINIQILGEVVTSGKEAEGLGAPSGMRRQQRVAGASAVRASGSKHVGSGGSDGGGRCARGGAAVEGTAAAGGGGGSGTSKTQDRSREPGTMPRTSVDDLSPSVAGFDPLAIPSGRLQIKMVPSTFLEDEFELYCRYQVSQHGDSPAQLSRGQYKRFLVDNPFGPVDRDRDASAPECGFGAFHQQFWLDGKLVAVGVVDVLPRCLSSVYFFWDTQLASLALGRFSALQEIRWVQQQVKSCPNLHYYYMGFYIHTCPKMRYKAEYRPSDLLCPVRKVWVRITPELLRALEQQPFLQLSSQPGALCQPNLAAPTGSPGAAEGSSTSQLHSTAPSPAAASSEAGSGAVSTTGVRGEGDGDVGVTTEDVGGTLVCWQGSGGPVQFKVLENLKLMPERAMLGLRQSIREWREVVGWTAPSLVYSL